VIIDFDKAIEWWYAMLLESFKSLIKEEHGEEDFWG
jgi:hypothetical protein